MTLNLVVYARFTIWGQKFESFRARQNATIQNKTANSVSVPV
jgi:hypothetical protein